MAFSQKIKKEVLRKAAFCCCVCRSNMLSVEVHHITPQKEGGSDEIDNAAPLCPNHHTAFGNNPEKRNRIREMRNWWYDQVAASYTNKTLSPDLLSGIYSSITSMHEKVDNQQNSIEDLKSDLRTLMDGSIESMDPTAAAVSGTAIDSAVSVIGGKDSAREEFFSDIKRLYTEPSSQTCRFCYTPMHYGSVFCPNCGKPIN